MSKYIDAEKLIAEIERRKKQDVTFRERSILIDIETAITTLQQDKPKVDLVEELKHHLANTPKEQLEAEWKELEPWGNIGPTVQEFLYGKQPEVDLEKEYNEQWGEYTHDGLSATIDRAEFEQIARHFYELARQKYEK